MWGVIFLKSEILVILLAIVVIVGATILLINMLEKPFLTAAECYQKDGNFCTEDEKCTEKVLGVVRNDEIGVCCPVPCVKR